MDNPRVDFDQEAADYILKHFSNLLTEKEALALKHLNSLYSLGSKPDPKRKKLMLKYGFLTNDPEVLKLLSNGYENFKLMASQRIINENKDTLFFNYCPKCGKEARTPFAKQCQHCFHSWHNS